MKGIETLAFTPQNESVLSCNIYHRNGVQRPFSFLVFSSGYVKAYTQIFVPSAELFRTPMRDLFNVCQADTFVPQIPELYPAPADCHHHDQRSNEDLKDCHGVNLEATSLFTRLLWTGSSGGDYISSMLPQPKDAH